MGFGVSHYPGMDESLGDITLKDLDGSLRDAAQKGSIDALYALIQSDAKVLDRIDEIPFVATPLHTAASAGHTLFALEIMRLKPSFARKLNQNGFTPMHLALQNNHTQLMLQLLDVDDDLVRVQGREVVTPLHYVAQIGNLEVLVKFLKACPKSIEDITIRRETVLHIALKYDMFDAFRLLLGWLQRAWFRDVSQWEKKLLNWQDEKGNTVLHIAASKNQTEIVRLLLKFSTVDINIKNSSDCKALDMLQLGGCHPQINSARRLIRRLRLLVFPSAAIADAKYFKAPVSNEEKLYIMFLRLTTKVTNDMRNVLLVVAALLFTVSFQAAISPPGGVWGEDKNLNDNSTENDQYAGKAIMGSPLFQLLGGLNATSFFVTAFTIFLLLPSGFGTQLFSLPLYTLSLIFILSWFELDPTTDAVHKMWVISPTAFICLLVIVSFRRNKLVAAFRPKVKVLDTSLTM
ncbi:ankyrin repeat-containing protein BDA1-like [Alnus glutinosa]|uniref:ankyrin repeat-containing protein BDA1-like n=1 Tax=Alnus glutinosa TaxID=3517 RepID=UPI002D79BC66|nr:ankyrin repeat-containing protein BDA1-like [Alnus glutinosa]